MAVPTLGKLLNMKSQFFLFGCLSLMIAIAGCSTAPPPPTPEASVTSPVTSKPSETKPTPLAIPTATESPRSSNLDAANPSSAAVSEDKKISATGIGQAKLGMTLGQLKKVLGTKAQFKVESPYIVDFDAIAVSQSGKVQYYILYPAGKPLADSDKIEFLETDNPDYLMDKGVRAGTTLKEAEAAYGDASLSYNFDNEGREYVQFANQPAKNISFRLGNANDGSLSGVYPKTSGEGGLYQTKDYKENSSIRLIELSCSGQSCGK